MAQIVTATDGVQLDLDSLEQTLAYSGSQVTSITVLAPNGHSYIQTLTYSGSNLTGVSQWARNS